MGAGEQDTPSLKRGVVADVPFQYTDEPKVKLRPVLIVQADDLDTELPNLIVVPFTSQMKRAGKPYRILFALGSPEFEGTGLVRDSILMVDRIQSVDADAIHRIKGAVTSMDNVDAALRIVLDLKQDAE